MEGKPCTPGHTEYRDHCIPNDGEQDRHQSHYDESEKPKLKKGKLKLYRGVGQGSDDSGFEWFSETPKLAERYADHRGGKVESAHVSIERPLSVLNPKAVLDAHSFFANAMKQVDMSSVDKKQAMQARKEFLEHFGEQNIEVMDYWSNPEAKKATRNLLLSLGFDSIAMQEGGEQTYASLNKEQIEKNDPIEKAKQDWKQNGVKSQAFKNWFGDWENDADGASKVVNAETKNPKVVYHGSRRTDRIGTRFDPRRATSGPMAFFTDDPELASSYSTNKQDTSLERPSDYAEWFLVKVPGSRKPVNIERAWYFLPYEKKQEIANLLPRVSNTDENGDSIEGYTLSENDYGAVSSDTWEWKIQQAKGNVLKAAKEIWLNGGMIFDREEEFLDILKLAGMNDVIFNHPYMERAGVYACYLNIRKPLDTRNISNDVMNAIKQAAKRKRGKTRGEGADQWDKRYLSGTEFISRLEYDRDNGTTHAWTSIPDWVTDTLRNLGYDGIKDVSGKNSKDPNNVVNEVWIPFEPEQIKSAIGNQGTFDPNAAHINKTLTKSCGCDDCQDGKECPCDAKAMSWLNTNSGGALVGAIYKPKIGDEVSVVDTKGRVWIEKGIVTSTDDKRTEVIGDEKTSGMFPNKYLKQLGKDLSHKHQYSSTQFDLAQAGYNRTQGSPIPALQAIQNQISDDDLAEDGKEDNFHVTVKYGLHGNDANEVREVVKQWMQLRQEQPGGLSCTATLGEVSLFPADESTTQRGGDQYDVVKVEVTSPDLEELNQFLSDNLEHTDTHPIYSPHITLAYVRPGMGRKYAGLHLKDHYVILHKLVFSDRDGEKTIIDFWEMDNIEPQSILPNLSGKGWFSRATKPEQPKQDVEGKPCPMGYNAERDNCIPKEKPDPRKPKGQQDTSIRNNEFTIENGQTPNKPKQPDNIPNKIETSESVTSNATDANKPIISGSAVNVNPETRNLNFDPNKIQELPKPSESQVLNTVGKEQTPQEWKTKKTRSKFFKSWFGDWENNPENASKVVDDKGEPKENYEVKKVYHGTSGDFDVFDSEKQGKQGYVAGKGFYFAENEEVANKYKRGPKGKILQVYLNIRNPFDFDKKISIEDVKKYTETIIAHKREQNGGEMNSKEEKEIRSDMLSGFRKSAIITGKQLHYFLSDAVGDEETNNYLAKLGFDGIMHRSSDLSGTPRVEDTEPDFGKVWVAFNPNQIKSVDNEGTFDTSNNHIGKNLSVAVKDTTGMQNVPKQDLRGKPCGVGQTKERDGCIPNEGQQNTQQPATQEQQVPKQTNAQQPAVKIDHPHPPKTSGSAANVHPETGNLHFDPSKVEETDKPSAAEVMGNKKPQSNPSGSKTAEGVPVEHAKSITPEQAKNALKWDQGLILVADSNVPNKRIPDATRPEFDEFQKGALQKYTYFNDRALNNKLRGFHWKNDTPYGETFFDAMHAQMQSAFAKAPLLDKPVKCVRGMRLQPDVLKKFMGNIEKAQETGEPISFDGYTSTSVPGGLMYKLGLSSGINDNFKGNVSLSINAVHGLDMKPYSQLPREEEFLLNHSSKFKVSGIKKSKDGLNYTIVLDQLPPEVYGKKSLWFSMKSHDEKSERNVDKEMMDFYAEHSRAIYKWIDKDVDHIKFSDDKKEDKKPKGKDLSIEEHKSAFGMEMGSNFQFPTVQDAGAFLARKWRNLEERYGRKTALAMAVASIVTFPIPFNITAVIAVAEGIRKLQGKDLSIAYKSDVEGQPCTPGHTEYRDGCIPANGESSPSRESSRNVPTYTPEQINEFRNRIPSDKRDRLDQAMSEQEAEQVQKKTGKVHPRIQTLLEASEQIYVTDDVIVHTQRPIAPHDLSGIMRSMTVEEKNELDRYLEQKQKNSVGDVEEAVRNFKPEIDRKRFANSAASSGMIIDWINSFWNDDEIKEVGDELAAAVQEFKDYGFYKGELGMQEFYEILEKHNAPQYMLDMWKEQQAEVIAKIDRDVETVKKLKIKEFRDEYVNRSFDRHGEQGFYLRNFYLAHKNESRFKGREEKQKGIWGKDGTATNDDVFYFDTSVGNSYAMSVYTKHSQIINKPIHVLQFSDEGGDFGVTGAGGAHEVFSKVTEASIAYVKNMDVPIMNFSAEEPSRQKLYDRLSKTVLASLPEYEGIFIPGKPKNYFIGKKEIIDDLKSHFGALAKSFDPEKPYEEITPEIEDEWFTEEGWEEEVENDEAMEIVEQEIKGRNLSVKSMTDIVGGCSGRKRAFVSKDGHLLGYVDKDNDFHSYDIELTKWMTEGVRGQSSIERDDVIFEIEKTITPDDPLYSLYLMEHLEKEGIRVYSGKSAQNLQIQKSLDNYHFKGKLPATPEAPHQDLHGKPCGIGQNAERDGCIPAEDDPNAQKPTVDKPLNMMTPEERAAYKVEYQRAIQAMTQKPVVSKPLNMMTPEEAEAYEEAYETRQQQHMQEVSKQDEIPKEHAEILDKIKIKNGNAKTTQEHLQKCAKDIRAHGDKLDKYVANVYKSGAIIKDAVLQLDDGAITKPYLKQIVKGDLKKAVKGLTDVPAYDLRAVPKIEIMNDSDFNNTRAHLAAGLALTDAEAYCNFNTGEMTMRERNKRGTYVHELGHAIHSAYTNINGRFNFNHIVVELYKTGKSAYTAYANLEYGNEDGSINADKKKQSLEHRADAEIPSAYGMTNHKEYFAEHFRLYHKAVRLAKEFGDLEPLEEHRKKFPKMSKLIDAHYTVALLGQQQSKSGTKSMQYKSRFVDYIGKDLSITAYKDMSGQECTIGHNATRDNCIPKKKDPTNKKPSKQKEQISSEHSEESDTDAIPAKQRAKAGKLVSARREGKGKDAVVILHGGKSAPEHIKPSMIPPAWKKVRVSLDPNADVQVTGIDGKGRKKTVYHDDFIANNQAAKFAKIREGLKKFEELSDEIQKDRSNPKFKELADCAWLMQEQATRPGGDGDTKGFEHLYGKKLTKDDFIIKYDNKGKASIALQIGEEKIPMKDEGTREEILRRIKEGADLEDSTYWLKSFGATTLEERHVAETVDGVRLRFQGKESKFHDHLIYDKELAAMLLERKKTAGERNGKLFDVDYIKIFNYVRKLDGGMFTPKDLRTMVATRLAIKNIKQMGDCCVDDESYKQSVMSVAEKVSKVLGNLPAQALESYISPMVWSVWKSTIDSSDD